MEPAVIPAADKSAGVRSSTLWEKLKALAADDLYTGEPLALVADKIPVPIVTVVCPKENNPISRQTIKKVIFFMNKIIKTLNNR